MDKVYSKFNYNFFDIIITKKRLEIFSIIKNTIDLKNINSCLDAGTSGTLNTKSTNILIENLQQIPILKSISDQKISLKYFNLCLNKSITTNFTNDEIAEMSCDLVISSATIEHVGNEENQIKMIRNIIKLSKKYFVITTPNRFYPIGFHTKLPFIHWLPKNIHRILLRSIGLKFFSKEENLNLFSKGGLRKIMSHFNELADYKIEKINMFYIASNFIVIGKIR
jgi:predicted transport protein